MAIGAALDGAELLERFVIDCRGHRLISFSISYVGGSNTVRESLALRFTPL
jgi:hypothetical protein